MQTSEWNFSGKVISNNKSYFQSNKHPFVNLSINYHIFKFYDLLISNEEQEDFFDICRELGEFCDNIFYFNHKRIFE